MTALGRRAFLGGLAAAGAWVWGRGGRLEGRENGRRYRAAVIGHTGRGNYGHGLEEIFRDRPGIEVVALADPDPTGRAAAMKRARAPRAYADYREMLTQERPDLVSVAPRWTDQHHAMVEAALNAGAHVYCEKPFTSTLAEADALLALAKRRGAKIAVAHQGRLAASTLHLKQRLEAGLIGELIEIRVHGKQDRRAGGEDLVVLGTHQFDLVRYWAGDPLWCVARITQQGREAGPADIRRATEDIGPVLGDEIQAMFALPGGVNVHYTSRAKNREAGPWGLRLRGTKGEVHVLSDVYPQILVWKGEPWTQTGASAEWRPLPDDPTAAAPAEARTMSAANRWVVDDWLAAIAEDREPVCSAYAATKALEMIHAVFAAGLSRGRVALPLANRRHPLAG